MNDIFSGQFSARINMNLREDKHWSYGVRSLFFDTRGQRPFISFSPVQTDKTAESMAELAKEYQNICRRLSLLPQKNLKDVPNSNTLGLPGSFETVQQLAGGYGSIIQYDLPEDYYNTFTQKVMALTPDGANAIAKKYILPNHLVWLVVGDMSKVESGITWAES